MSILRPLKCHLQGELKTLNGHISSETHFPKMAHSKPSILSLVLMVLFVEVQLTCNELVQRLRPLTHISSEMHFPKMAHEHVGCEKHFPKRILPSPLPPLSGVALAQVYIYSWKVFRKVSFQGVWGGSQNTIYTPSSRSRSKSAYEGDCSEWPGKMFFL